MENRKKGQMKTIVALFILMIISVLIVGAVTTSYGSFIFRFNDSLNLTLHATVSSQDVVEQEIDTSKIGKNKLNIETQSFLKEAEDKEQQKEFIVRFKNTIDESKLSKVSIEKTIGKFKVAKVKGKVKYVEDLLDDSEIEFIELEQNIETLEETIPFNIKKTKADEVWDKSKGSGVKVAVLDTGIASHSDLNIANGYSVVSNNYNDNNGHGTSVAGVISALINNEGLIGTAPEIELYAVKIMESSSGSLSDAIAGLEWAIDNNMDIVSMSFGFNSYSQIFKEVVQEAYNNGILLVAAAGNNGKDNILYPAKYNKVIAVGAVDKNNERASFSSYGFDMELVAPGIDINSTSLNNQYSTGSGTSMSTPHVTGIAALIKSYNNSLTNIQIRNKLRNDALDLGDNSWDWLYGYGLVQANLETFDFTPNNDSYFYEIYNITNYNTHLQTNIFWTEAQGHIDYVYFNPGLYLVNITKFDVNKHYIYNVSENGSVFILSETIGYSETFSTEGGTTTDGIGWINEDLNVLRTDTGAPQVDVECFDLTSGPSLPYDYCYGIDDQEMADCDSDFSRINCSSGTTCDDTNKVGQNHPIIDSSSVGSGQTIGEFFWGCGGGAGQNTGTTNSPTWYVVSKKRARCTDTTNYVVEGWYGGSSWVTYDTDSCGAGYTCVDTQNYTSKTAYINPCVAPNTCTGTVQVITEDNTGSPINGTNIYRDGEFRGTTNEFGFANFNLTKTCQQTLTYNVTCPASGDSCGVQTTSMDTINDYKSLVFDCSVCSDRKDMEISVDDVEANVSTGRVRVTINLIRIPPTSNINVTFKVQGSDGLISDEIHGSFSVTGITQKTATVTESVALSGGDFLHVYVDANNKVTEDNEKNNYARVPLFKKEITAYIDVNTSYPLVDQKIKETISQYVKTTNNPDNAEVSIVVGRKSPQFERRWQFTGSPILKNTYYYHNGVQYNYRSLSQRGLPYAGIVGGYKDLWDGKDYILAFGNDIDGDIAAVKKLISARTLFFDKVNLDEERTKLIDDLDRTGIAVADLLRDPSNFVYYTQRRSAGFANVVDRILNNNNFEIAIQTVKTTDQTSYGQNTTLRLKNVNSDFSDNFKDVITNGSKPVVMSGGIFSHLFTWEGDNKNGLAWDLVNDGHDVWEIEMNGYKNTECTDCPDYTYQDQVDYFWPALVAGVMNYSGKNQVNYIGHSNGCRVALSSLNAYSNGKNSAGWAYNSVTGLYDLNISLPNLPVDKFFGVACPGTLNDGTVFVDTARTNIIPLVGPKVGNVVMSTISDSHVVMKDYTKRALLIELVNPFSASFKAKIVFIASMFSEDNKISRNLLDFYNDLAIDTSSQFDVSNVNVNRMVLFNGKPSDFIVPFEDQAEIFDSLTITNKSKDNINTFIAPIPSINDHSVLKESNKFKKIVMGELR